MWFNNTAGLKGALACGDREAWSGVEGKTSRGLVWLDEAGMLKVGVVLLEPEVLLGSDRTEWAGVLSQKLWREMGHPGRTKYHLSGQPERAGN